MTSSTRQQLPERPANALDEAGIRPTTNALARFGQINFVNSLPLTLPLLKADLANSLAITLANPAELNKGYSDGLLDVGAMSSFFYLEHGGFSLVPKISIASVGKVGSVLFFARRELMSLKSKALAITAASATSVNLLKLLFLETAGFVPYFEVQATPAIDDLFDGALVIGDRALHVDAEWSQNYLRIDLGQWWFDTFGLPMVFGVWAGRNEWVNQDLGRFNHLCDSLRKLFDLGLGTQFSAVLAEAATRTGLAEDRLRTYYRTELNFDLSDRHLQGLELYASLCRKHQLLDS